MNGSWNDIRRIYLVSKFTKCVMFVEIVPELE